jgi:hypothetical protein
VIGGRHFDSSSTVNFFVSSAGEPLYTGPVIPKAFTSTSLTTEFVDSGGYGVQGAGVVAVQIVNADQGFAQSNVALALVQGNPALGLPTLSEINSTGIAADSTQPGFAVANVETVVPTGLPMNLGGSDFDTTHGVAVDLFCVCPGGKVGPFFLNPGDPGLSATNITLNVPGSGPNQPATGPASFRVSNAGTDGEYTQQTAAVATVIGARVSTSTP